MKRFLLAFAIAIGAAVSAPVPEVAAASITFNQNGVTVRDGRHDGYRHHRRHYREGRRHFYRDGRYRDYHRRYAYRDHCRTRTVKTYRHHRVIIRKIRVCG